MVQLKSILKTLLPPNSKQWKVFLACLGISTILWGLLRFSEGREDELQIVLEFNGLPKDKVLVSEIPETMPVKIYAQGFDLITRSLSFNRPKVVINFSDMILIEKGDLMHYVWLPKLNSKAITKAIGAKLRSSIYPIDSVKISFSEITEKILPTGLSIATKSDNLHIIKTPLLQPAFVKVRGAKSVLNRMDTIFTQETLTEQLQTDLDADFALQLPKGVLSLSTDSVRVFIGVETVMGYQYEIPIKIKNVPDSLEVRLFPNEVKVLFNCGSGYFSTLTPRQFTARVDYNDIKMGHNNLTVQLTEFPFKIKSPKLEPANVEYILKTKD